MERTNVHFSKWPPHASAFTTQSVDSACMRFRLNRGKNARVFYAPMTNTNGKRLNCFTDTDHVNINFLLVIGRTKWVLFRLFAFGTGYKRQSTGAISTGKIIFLFISISIAIIEKESFCHGFFFNEWTRLEIPIVIASIHDLLIFQSILIIMSQLPLKTIGEELFRNPIVFSFVNLFASYWIINDMNYNWWLSNILQA